MATLWPITTHGSGDDQSDVLKYAERDFYGVEALAASATDFRGFNELTAYTRRQYETATAEHAASGIHNTVKIARLVVALRFDGSTTYDIVNPSYSQVTSSGVRRYGSAIGSVSRAAAGAVDVTLTDSLPAASGYKLIDFTSGSIDKSGAWAVKQVRVMLNSVTDATHFQVKRIAGTTLSTMAAEDGFMRFVIHY